MSFALLRPVLAPLGSSMRDRARVGFLPLSLGPQAVFGVVSKVSGAAFLWSIIILQRFGRMSVEGVFYFLSRPALLVSRDNSIKGCGERVTVESGH